MMIKNSLRTLLILIALALFLILFSFDPQDDGWHQLGLLGQAVHNWGGAAGAWLASLLFSLFGYAAYALPLALIFLGWASPLWISIGLWLSVFSGAALAQIYAPQALIFGGGGLLGQWLWSQINLGSLGFNLILLWFILLLGLHCLSGFYTLKLADQIGRLGWQNE